MTNPRRVQLNQCLQHLAKSVKDANQSSEKSAVRIKSALSSETDPEANDNEKYQKFSTFKRCQLSSISLLIKQFSK